MSTATLQAATRTVPSILADAGMLVFDDPCCPACAHAQMRDHGAGTEYAILTKRVDEPGRDDLEWRRVVCFRTRPGHLGPAQNPDRAARLIADAGVRVDRDHSTGTLWVLDGKVS